MLLVIISQTDYALTFRIYTHTSASGKSHGYSIIRTSAISVAFGATVTEPSWTGDTGFTKVLLGFVDTIVYFPLGYVVIGNLGVNDHLDEVAAASDGSALYLHSANCTWDSSNHNCEGYML